MLLIYVIIALGVTIYYKLPTSRQDGAQAPTYTWDWFATWCAAWLLASSSIYMSSDGWPYMSLLSREIQSPRRSTQKTTMDPINSTSLNPGAEYGNLPFDQFVLVSELTLYQSDTC